MIRAQAGRLGVQTIDANVITYEQGEAVFWRGGREVVRVPLHDLLALEVLPEEAPDRAAHAGNVHPNAYSPWSPELDSVLLDMARRGVPVRTIAKGLGRGPGGISSRLHHLGFDRGGPGSLGGA